MTAVYHSSPEQPTKICSKCGIEKPLDQFSAHVSSKDGIRAYCRVCASEYIKQYNHDHPRKPRENPLPVPPGTTSKVCAECHVEKPLDDFAKSKSGRFGVRSRCRACRLEEERLRRSQFSKPRPTSPDTSMTSKLCLECAKEKPIGEFYKVQRKSGNFSYQRICKSCAYDRQKRAKFWKGVAEYKQLPLFVFSRVCTKCKTEQNIECFTQDSTWCKSCVRQYNLDYRAANQEHKNKNDLEYYYANRENILEKRIVYNATHQEQLREQHCNYRKANPLKVLEFSRRHIARKKAAMIDEEVNYHRVLERDGYWCYICEKPIDPTTKDELAKLSFDHVVALACGGDHAESNIKPAHKACNSRKQDRALEEMTPFQRRGVH